MSFYDDASLAFLASGGAGKDTKAYSIKPTNGDGDFTFSRGSNLTATRVDSNGLIEKGRENLLTQSNSFDNAIWIGRSQTTLTEGQGGYDGSNDAWSCGTTTGQIMGQSKVNQGVQTISVYAKGSVSNGLRIFAFGNDNVDFWFNLNTGLPDGTISSKVIDYNIEDVNGDGEWYRCSFTFSQTTSSIYFYCTDNNRSNASGTIYLQDAQLEIGLVATEYIESGATTGLGGILEDSPRFDYSGGASCPSLLLEPQRSNIVGFTEYIEGTNWGVGGSTGLQLRTSIASPDGNNGVYLVTSEAENTSSRVQYNLGTLGNDHIFSVFIKGTGSATRIRLRNNAASVNSVEYDIDSSGNFTLNTESAHDGYYGVDDYGNGWHRVYLKVDTNSGGNNFMQIFSDVVDADGSIYVWGVQAEDASYITSYIPNHSGGSVTREADYSESSTSLSIGDSEFCVYYEMDTEVIPRENFNQFFRVEFGGNSNYIGIKGSSNIINNTYTLQTQGNYSETMGNVTEVGVVKFLINYSNGTGDLFVNGTKYDGVISGPTTGNTITNIELSGSGYSHDSKQILLFPTALSDADCITLTS